MWKRSWVSLNNPLPKKISFIDEEFCKGKVVIVADDAIVGKWNYSL